MKNWNLQQIRVLEIQIYITGFFYIWNYHLLSLTAKINSSRIETTRRLLKRYANINQMIGNDKDEYGIMTLTDVAEWVGIRIAVYSGEVG